jgi:SAM-dependent methyltransferase
MDLDDPRYMEVFFEIHSGLPREGPGCRAATVRALALIDPLPERPRVLDIGCGPGMQTLALAELLPDAAILAVDNHQPFLDELERSLDPQLRPRVTTRLGDMADLGLERRSADIIWCEGAAYVVGVASALRKWRPLLDRPGYIALSEAVWLRSDPPEELRTFWTAYPDLRDVEGNLQLIEECGYETLGHFVLPEQAWWEHYYTPIEAKLAPLEARHAGDAAALAVVEEARHEIEMFRRYADYYGYAFFVVTPAD